MPRERGEDSLSIDRPESPPYEIPDITHTHTKKVVHVLVCNVTVRPVGGYDDRACGITAL